ncbi:MAG: hypothetical protein H8E31_00455 [Planctomycetes bacterium]|nr:hypothetical protein [Planctomycetota bacterium]
MEEVVEAVQATARVAKRFEEPAERALPEELGELAPRRLRERLAGPDPGRRAEAWGHVLSRGKLRSDDLLAIFEWERDGLVRLGVLWSLRDRRIKSDEDAARILALAVDGDNDHVRSEAIALSVGLRPEAAAEILKEVMRIVLDGCAWSNPNNMLVAATQAAVEVASPDLLEPLGRVLASTETNNSAHHYARDALRKIGKQPRMRKAVEEILARHGYD